MTMQQLSESGQQFQLSLKKKGVVRIKPMEIGFALDVSGSYMDEHQDGTTQLLVDALVPWGEVFDPDHKMDVCTFSNGERNMVHHSKYPLTVASSDGYVKRHVINCQGYGGGTDFAPVLSHLRTIFGQVPEPKPWNGPKLCEHFLTVVPPKHPALALVVTDGVNNDKVATRMTLRDAQQRGEQVYFLFIAVRRGQEAFEFLHQIAKEFDNTGLVIIDLHELKALVSKGVEALNDRLLGAELVKWLSV